MKKSTRKGQSPKLQVVNKNWAALEGQPLLQANPQAALPLLSMIGQAQLSIEDLLGRLSRQFVEQLLILRAVRRVRGNPAEIRNWLRRKGRQ
jgi:hypothetical protein